MHLRGLLRALWWALGWRERGTLYRRVRGDPINVLTGAATALSEGPWLLGSPASQMVAGWSNPDLEGWYDTR